MSEEEGAVVLRSRPAARVLLVDPADRLLLLKHVLLHPERDTEAVWVPVGGGLEEDESFEAAALRELQGRVALRDVALGPCVWHRHNQFAFFGEDYRVEERYFLCRVESFDVADLLEPDEQEGPVKLNWRWWAADEIEASSESFAPRDLGRLLRPLLAGEIPVEPVKVRDLPRGPGELDLQ